MSGHTPGPWRFKRVNNLVLSKNSSANLLLDGEDFNVGLLSCWRDNPETEAEATANAHLIAAAPELLEALALCLVQLEAEHMPSDEVMHAMHHARAAIAKAKGGA